MSSSYTVGLGNAASYQVSGRPYASGSIDAATAPASLTFPAVTRWVQVTNNSTTDLKVGFSAHGVEHIHTRNYFVVPGGTTWGPVELKITQLHLDGGTAGNTHVCAGLTFIKKDAVDNPGISPVSPYINWTGSAGVG